MEYALIYSGYKLEKFSGEPLVKIWMNMFRKTFEYKLDGPVELRLKAKDGEYKLSISVRNEIIIRTLDNIEVARFISDDGIFTKEIYSEIRDLCSCKPLEIIQCSDCRTVTTDVGGKYLERMLCHSCYEQKINERATRQTAIFK